MSRQVFVYMLMLVCLWWVPTDVVQAAEGSELFAKRCGSCHYSDGKADPISPADKAEVVWGKYFKRDRHPGKLSTISSSEELTSILEYLQRHAADSDVPLAAAIPKG